MIREIETRSAKYAGAAAPEPQAATQQERRQEPIEIPAVSFDHLVGCNQQACGYGQPKRFRGLEVDGGLESCGRLYRQFADLVAPQNAIDVGGGKAEHVELIGPVG